MPPCQRSSLHLLVLDTNDVHLPMLAYCLGQAATVVSLRREYRHCGLQTERQDSGSHTGLPRHILLTPA